MTLLQFNVADLDEQAMIPIGIRAENDVTQVALDFSAWAEEFGAGVVQLLLKRSGDSAPYPVLLTQSGSTALWTVSVTDLAYKGQLLAEWVYTVGTQVKKSVVLRTLVLQDIGAPGTAPDPYEDWLEQLTALAAQAEAAAEAIQDMGVEAETLKPGSAATVTKTVDPETGAVTLTFGIPRGQDGSGGGVTSVNGQTGEVDLDAEDVGALPSDATLDDIADGETYKRATAAQLAQIAQNAGDIVEVEAEALGAYLQKTATGAVATFVDGAAVPAVDVTVAIEPVQSGSGNPSPENIRPITGWTGLTLSQSGADTSDPYTLSVSWQSEAGTVYGGTLDLTTGILTVTKALFTIGADTTVAGTSTVTDYTRVIYAYANLPIPTPAAGQGLFSHGVWQENYVNDTPHYYNNATQFIVFVPGNTQAAALAYIAAQEAAGTPLQISYTLATPVTYQLTAHEIDTLLGANNIWADTGDTTVVYRAKPSVPSVPAAATAAPQDLAASAAVGTSTAYAREDHKHKMPSASDVGAVAAPASPSIGDFMVYTANGWDAMTLAVWQGGNYGS